MHASIAMEQEKYVNLIISDPWRLDPKRNRVPHVVDPVIRGCEKVKGDGNERIRFIQSWVRRPGKKQGLSHMKRLRKVKDPVRMQRKKVKKLETMSVCKPVIN